MGDSFHPHTGLHTMESTPLEGKRKLRPNQAKKVANPTSIRHHGSEVRLSEQRPPSALRHLTSETANNFHMSYDQVNAKKYREVTIEDLRPPSSSDRSDIPERCMPDIAPPERTKLSDLSLFTGKPSGHDPVSEWRIVREHLLREGRLDPECALALVTRTADHLAKQPNVLELEAPISICGDVHGQFFDLCNLLDVIGDPGNTKYLFLGDYVDRGDFSTEVCFLLFAILLSFPNSFFLLRGNHESRLLTTNFNFRLECFCKYSPLLYAAFVECFDYLPVAAVITCQDESKRYFCCHGGLSPHLRRIEDINQIDRHAEPPADGLLCDLLWADPLNEEEIETLPPNEVERWKNVEFRHNANRGCSYEFGYAAVNNFLEENRVTTIIRAHEVKRYGYAEHFKDTRGCTSGDVPPVITVFSAPNYCDMYENKAGYLNIGTRGKLTMGNITWTSHPYWLPDFEDAFTFSLPFMGECMVNMYLRVLQYLGVEEERLPELQSAFHTIQTKRKVRVKRIQFAKKALTSGKDAFRRAQKLDHDNEKRPDKPKPTLKRSNSMEW